MKNYLLELKKVNKDLGYDNYLAGPRLNKITINMGVGKVKDDKNFMESAKRDLSNIAGQMPNVRKAKLSIAGFKIRQGDVVGLALTLRGEKMWDFYQKLVKIVLPRFRDFKGLSKKSLDSQGNYSLGIKEQVVFPEIDANKVDKIKSFEVVLSIKAKNKDEGYKFLKAFGFPFRD